MRGVMRWKSGEVGFGCVSRGIFESVGVGAGADEAMETT